MVDAWLSSRGRELSRVNQYGRERRGVSRESIFSEAGVEDLTEEPPLGAKPGRASNGRVFGTSRQLKCKMVDRLVANVSCQVDNPRERAAIVVLARICSS